MMGGISVSTVFGSLQIILVNIYAHLQMHISRFTCEHIKLHMSICIYKDDLIHISTPMPSFKCT